MSQRTDQQSRGHAPGPKFIREKVHVPGYRVPRLTRGGILIALLLASCLVLLLTPFLGINALSFQDILAGQEGIKEYKIFWQIRMPRVLVAFLAGGTFAVCGMALQAIFRNPLVSPFTLGVSAGASFGAAVYIWLRLSFVILGISGISLFSFLGAMLAMIIIWSLSKVKYGLATTKMLLAGVAVSFFFVSLIMFIQYLSDVNEAIRISRWLMGSLFVFGYDPVLNLLPFAVGGGLVLFYLAPELNLLTTGEELAKSRGVDTARIVSLLFLIISLMVGGVVSICGPIAFIGIIAPHICRLLIGFDHRYLTMATFLFGGLFLTLCDTLARILAAPAEIPVGVITALLGGPFFLWLLVKQE